MNRVVVLLISLAVALAVDASEVADSVGVAIPSDSAISIAATDSVAVPDNLTAPIKHKRKKNLLLTVVGAVGDFLMGCDTNYVTRVPYHLTAELSLDRWSDYYMMNSMETGNCMIIKSDPSLVVGGYLYFSCLGYGISYNVADIGKPKGKTNGTGIRSSLSLHTAKFFAEMYQFNSGKSAKIVSISGVPLSGIDTHFSGLDSRCSGLSAIYIFNNKRFSWPAAYSGSAVQKKSCGSWSVGFQYNNQRVTLNKDELPEPIKEVIDPSVMFDAVDYSDFNITGGYSYNWVIRRNLLLAGSILPNIGYRRSNITEEINAQQKRHSIIEDISTDLNLRISLMWNNKKVYAALMLEAHTYSYRKDQLALTNSYGTIKFLLGLQMIRKKPAH